MTVLLGAKPIVEEMKARAAGRVAALAGAGVVPTLCVVRVGARDDDIAYEQTILRAAAAVGVEVRVACLGADAAQGELMACIEAANADAGVHGILMFRPLPAHLDERAATGAIAAGKDVDGVSEGSMARLYEAKRLPRDASGAYLTEGIGFFLPCTAESVMRLLWHYGVGAKGRRAVVVGRSAVIGKPAALLLMMEDATVTIAHSKSAGLAGLCAGADILVVCAGAAVRDAGGRMRGGFGRECLSEGQTVIDVGIHADEGGRLFGDVDFEAADGLVAAITPVPGGVGSVTTQVLIAHVVAAAAG